MPYKRKRYGTKKYKKSYKRRKTANTRTMYRIAKKVVRMNTELKYVDYGLSGSQDYNGTILNVTALINQGDAENQRDGSKLRVKGMKVTVQFVGQQNSGVTQQVIRYVVVRGFAENNTAMTVGTVLTQVGTSSAPISAYSFSQSKKYKVIDNKRFTMSAGYSAIATPTVPGFSTRKFYSKYYKFDHDVEYLSNTTNVMDGGIYIIGISDEATSANNPIMFYNVRLYFTDS